MENYIKLNKNKIFEEANKLMSQNLSYSDELFQSIGGNNLNKIFDEYTIKSIMHSIIYNQKIHPSLEDDGIDLLEGFLNNKVTKPIGEFYNINPEYILSLPPEEQSKMAEAVCEGNKDLEKVLTYLWCKNIKTIACGGKSNPGYLYVNIPLSDITTISTFKSLYEKNGFPVSIDFNYLCNKGQENSLSLTVFGPPEQLYSTFLSEFKDSEKTEKTDFSNSFYFKILDNINFQANLMQTESQHKQFSEADVEQLLEESYKQYEELEKNYSDLQKNYDSLFEEHSILKEKYSKLKQNFSTVKNFVVNKIGKFPFLGKRVIKLLDDSLKNNALPAPENNLKDDNSEYMI